MNDAGNSGGESRYFKYCLVGFDSFLDFRTIEFCEQLPDAHICDNCGAVSGQVTLLPCMHTMCKRCYGTKHDYRTGVELATCAVDRKDFGDKLPIMFMRDTLHSKRVRCSNTLHGCNHTCTLRELGNHFPKCQFVGTSCPLCGTGLPFEKLGVHYAACRSLLSSAATTLATSKQLIQDLTNATKEVEEAVTEKSSDQTELRQKMDSVLEVVEKLRVQVGYAST